MAEMTSPAVNREIQVLRIAVRLLNRHGRSDAALDCVRVMEEIRRAEESRLAALVARSIGQ